MLCILTSSRLLLQVCISTGSWVPLQIHRYLITILSNSSKHEKLRLGLNVLEYVFWGRSALICWIWNGCDMIEVSGLNRISFPSRRHSWLISSWPALFFFFILSIIFFTSFSLTGLRLNFRCLSFGFS